MPTAKAMAAKIISKGSYAVSVAKAAINNGYDMDIKNAVEMEANLFGEMCIRDRAERGRLQVLSGSAQIRISQTCRIRSWI